jgi:hypothetical protein
VFTRVVNLLNPLLEIMVIVAVLLAGYTLAEPREQLDLAGLLERQHNLEDARYKQRQQASRQLDSPDFW